MLDALRAAVDTRIVGLHELTARLVRERSLLGAEEGAQRLVEERLHALGFAVERVQPDAAEALADPLAGLPLLPYEGRTCVAGRLAGTGGGRSLHLNGHIDVVPVEAVERWTRDPWGGEIADGRLWGRGSGDMKGGLAAYLVAVEALLETGLELAGDILFTSVIEEECGGNGMRAVLAAGYRGDGTLIGEPTDLGLDLSGVGVIWARLTARSEGAHAAAASEYGRPVDEILGAVAGLRALEQSLNEGADGHPYNLNVGELRGGVWPSSVPAEVVLRCRLGFGAGLDPAGAQELLRAAVAKAAPSVEVELEGFRAQAYRNDEGSELARLLASCHARAHGAPPPQGALSTATTDARYVEGPCACYGPIAGNIHGIDEWVNLASARDTALTVALTAASWCGG
ncbi:MAG: M20/M25/M40 family metallo-hydrolase [Thermoleophilia bacterium]|nr:M20/M25/M40 family metallo-hydrolase [Thermoleophilia bacterium]